jgi:hypothetical protein
MTRYFCDKCHAEITSVDLAVKEQGYEYVPCKVHLPVWESQRVHIPYDENVHPAHSTVNQVRSWRGMHLCGKCIDGLRDWVS